MSGASRRKVAILGGGVAGMSAAHELLERDFDVEVWEAKSIPGGKARSIATSEPLLKRSPFGADRGAMRPVPSKRPSLPGEHGFRFFPGFYKHVVDTMARIPTRTGSVADHLVDTTELKIAPFDRPAITLPSEFPRTTGDLRTDVIAAIVTLSGELGVPYSDALFFAAKIWQIITSCEERRFTEYERVNWWDFIEAETQSFAYQRFFGNAITRSLVAAKARRASTKTIGDIFVQIVFDVVLPGVAADRLLDGPTSDVWIHPWLAHLRDRGVVYHMDAEVVGLECNPTGIRAAIVRRNGTLQRVAADFFICALPVERMAGLVSQDLLRLDPSFANLSTLMNYTEWMNGIQFYLNVDVPITKGHAIYLDSPWALTSVSQAQFWKDFDLSTFGDGTVRGLLSVDISDWDVKGLNGKEARNCSRDEVARETWEQLKRSLNHDQEILRDRDLHSWFLDPDIQEMNESAGNPKRTLTNAEPLLVNYVDTWRIRPEAVTRIPNLFLASDYVRTFTDLATMEAANEAARRAVNGVLQAARSASEPCRLWNLHEPDPLLPFRAYDRVRFRKGLPWDDQSLGVVGTVLRAGSEAAERTPMNDPSSLHRGNLGNMLDSRSPERAGVNGTEASRAQLESESAAADARASSDGGLGRLRIIRANDP